MPAPLKVLFVASECAPFAKTGGLADVAGALPKALRQLDIDVRVVMPLYAGMPWNDLEILDGFLEVPMWWGSARARVRVGKLPGSQVPIYCLEFNRYFDRPHLYGPPAEGYPDNLERFTFLSRGSLELCKALGFIPDVIHCNDWQTALIPTYVNTVEWMQPLHASATVYSIHNLAYQGVFDGGATFITGLGREHYNPNELEHFGALNLTKGALHHGTLLSTVSPTYAREIQTGLYGNGLDGTLAARSGDLVGILNGIDVDEWNPSADTHLPAAFGVDKMAGKAACKAALQKEAGFAVRPDIPLFGVIGRLTPQKGFDVLAHALERVLGWDVQLVLLGTGDPDAERFFAWADAHRGDRFRAWLRFDNGRAHRIEAGADFFLMPSRFEPCGLNQMYSLRYGTLPIVRATGGLVDTVANYDQSSAGGTGFVFTDLNPDALANTIGWAVSTWFDRPEHIETMRRRAMLQDFSWERAAGLYRQLYLRAYEKRRGHAFESLVGTSKGPEPPAMGSGRQSRPSADAISDRNVVAADPANRHGGWMARPARRSRGVRLALDPRQMRRANSTSVRPARALVVFVGACLSALGCGLDPCNPAIDPSGGRYDVYVTALPTRAPSNDDGAAYAASTGSCAGFDGLVPGATLSFQTVGANENQGALCRSAVAELLTGPAALSRRSASSDPLAGRPPLAAAPFMTAFANVATPSCSGASVLLFFEDGQLYRLFLPSSGDCSVCDDTFAIELIHL